MMQPGNAFSFGSESTDPSVVQGAGVNSPTLAPDTPDFFGVPLQALGMQFGESFFHGLTSKPVDAAAVYFSNLYGRPDKQNWQTGQQVMDSYPDLHINLDPKIQMSPDAVAHVVQSAGDSLARQNIIAGSAAQHPLWNMAGGFLGGLVDPVFTVPWLLTDGVGGAALKGAEELGAPAAENLFTKPLSGIWGSRVVEGAAQGASVMSAATLATEPFSKAGGQEETDPKAIWANILGGTVAGGVLHPFFGMIGDKFKLNTDNPAIQAPLAAASNEITVAKLSGVDVDPEAVLAKHLEPTITSLGQVMDKIDAAGTVDHGSLTPDELQAAPEGSEVTQQPGDNSREQLAQDLATDPNVELVTTPEERAVLRAKTPEDLADVAGDQIKRLRDTVVQFGEKVSNALDNGENIEKGDAEFQQLRRSANGALTSLKRQLGDTITPEKSELLTHLSDIVKKIASQDPDQVKGAIADLNILDGKLADAKVLSPDELHTQLESMKAELAKTERGLKSAKKPETIDALNSKKESLTNSIQELSDKLPQDYTSGKTVSGPTVPDLDKLRDLVGASATLDGQELGRQKNQIIAQVADRIKAIQEWQRAISPTTGEIADPNAQLMQQYNEEMAAAGAMTPGQFLEEQTKNLDSVIQQIKDTPNWKDGRALARIEEIEKDYKEAMDKADGVAKSAKQALACSMQGDLT